MGIVGLPYESIGDIPTARVLGNVSGTTGQAQALTAEQLATLVGLDLTGYATEAYVDAAIEAIPAIDLTGYATESYVDDAIEAIPAVDLSSYAQLSGATFVGRINAPDIKLGTTFSWLGTGTGLFMQTPGVSNHLGIYSGGVVEVGSSGEYSFNAGFVNAGARDTKIKRVSAGIAGVYQADGTTPGEVNAATFANGTTGLTTLGNTTGGVTIPGKVVLPDNDTGAIKSSRTTGFGFLDGNPVAGGIMSFGAYGNRVTMPSSVGIGWNASSFVYGGAGPDTQLKRVSAGIAGVYTSDGTTPGAFQAAKFNAQNGTTATEILAYNTYTSDTSFETLRVKANTGAAYQIGSAIGSAGGTNRDLEFGYWNSAGTFNVGLRISSDGRLTSNGIYIGAHSYDGQAFYKESGSSFMFSSTPSIGSRGFGWTGVTAIDFGTRMSASSWGASVWQGSQQILTGGQYVSFEGTSTIGLGSGKKFLWTSGDGRNGLINGQGEILLGRDTSGVLRLSGANSTEVSLVVDGRISCGSVVASNGTTPTSIEARNTYTSATSFETLQIKANTGAAYQIGSAIGSAGGTNRDLEFGYWNSAGTFDPYVKMDSLSRTLRVQGIVNSEYLTISSTLASGKSSFTFAIPGYGFGITTAYGSEISTSNQGMHFHRKSLVLSASTYSPKLVSGSSMTAVKAVAVGNFNATLIPVLCGMYGGGYAAHLGRHHGTGAGVWCGYGATSTTVDSNGGNAGDFEVWLNSGGAGNGSGLAGADGQFRIVNDNTDLTVFSVSLTGGMTLSDRANFSASTISTSSLNIPSGVAPTTPTDGDMWCVGDVLYRRIAGVTKSVTFS